MCFIVGLWIDPGPKLNLNAKGFRCKFGLSSTQFAPPDSDRLNINITTAPNGKGIFKIQIVPGRAC